MKDSEINKKIKTLDRDNRISFSISVIFIVAFAVVLTFVLIITSNELNRKIDMLNQTKQDIPADNYAVWDAVACNSSNDYQECMRNREFSRILVGQPKEEWWYSYNESGKVYSYLCREVE